MPIDPHRITKEVAAGEAVLLDVRHDDEWEAGHTPCAERFLYEDIEAGKLPNIPKDTKIYTICNSGGRAGRAKAMLEAAGFANVENAQGVIQWAEAGGDIARDAA